MGEAEYEGLPGELAVRELRVRVERAGYRTRVWCTVRQRCARFVRKTLSFSKCALNHVGALWFFIRQYNASRL